MEIHSIKFNKIILFYFRPDVISVSANCSGTYDAPNMVLKYPSVSSSTTNNTDCSWMITAPVDKSVTLEFTTFQIKSSVNCINSALQIFDGQTANSRRIGEKLCGSTLPDEIESTGRSLFLKFSSNVPITTSEFEISYVTGKSLNYEVECRS